MICPTSSSSVCWRTLHLVSLLTTEVTPSFFQLPASPFLCNCLWHLGPCFIRFYTIRWVNLLRGPFIIYDPANRTVQYYVVGSLCLGGMVCKAGEFGGGHVQWNCSRMNKSISHLSQGNVGTSTRIFAYSVAHLKDWEKKKVSGFVMRLLMCILFNKISWWKSENITSSGWTLWLSKCVCVWNQVYLAFQTLVTL